MLERGGNRFVKSLNFIIINIFMYVSVWVIYVNQYSLNNFYFFECIAGFGSFHDTQTIILPWRNTSWREEVPEKDKNLRGKEELEVFGSEITKVEESFRSTIY